MIEIINMILNKMEKICKPQQKFIMGVLTILLSARGKMNFRNMSRYSDFEEKTFSRNYEKPFNFSEFNQHALSFVIKPETRLIAAFDPSFIKKSGKKTYGKDYFWNGSASKAEKGLEVGLLAVVDVDYNTAYPVSAQQTPPIASSRKNRATEVTIKNRVDAYLEHISKEKRYLPSVIAHLVVDGYFSKERFVAGVKNMGLDVIGKLRLDARLRFLYQGERNRIGRPKKYDGAVNINDHSQLQFIGEIDVEEDVKVKIYSAIVNSISLACDVRIVLLVDDNNKNNVDRALLFSTDLNLSAFDIYYFYKARYQIEFLFRDAKQFVGLADCQARSKEKLDWHFNASFAALNVAKIEDRLSKKASDPSVFSMASSKIRHFNEKLIEKVFSMFDFDLTLIKLTPQFEKLRNYRAILYDP